MLKLNIQLFSDPVGPISKIQLPNGDQYNLNATTLQGKSASELQDIYLCTYGTTTYAQVTQAISAGKLPVVTYSDRNYLYQFTRNDGVYVFACIDSLNSTIYHCYIATNSSWSVGNKTVENTNNKVTTISSSSTDTQYPSAKLVYDQLAGKQETLVSGTNIKTINNTSLLGSGNINVIGSTMCYEEIIEPYLTFSSPNTFTLNVVDNLKYWDGTLEYSTNTTNWSTWDGTTTLSSSSSGTTKYLYLRGIDNTYITGENASASKAKWVLIGSNISCSGNIDNLLDYQTVVSGNYPSMDTFCYYYMFSNCTSLTKAPELGADSLGPNAYGYMFSNCTGLTTAPELPATTLAPSCYQGMFYGCTNLESLPELTTTTLRGRCYQQMFEGCSKIKLSTTQTGEYQNAYRIPTTGTGTDAATSGLTDMFALTGGTFTGTPSINTTYYTSNTIIPSGN